MRPLVIDNFAGGGGASTGIEAAIGRAIDVAINHDAEAVAMHVANHPATRHFCQSIMAVDPLVATCGAPVALVWFSPDCKHHSKAKGGKPREKGIRDLAWVVVQWVERLQAAFRQVGRPPRDAIQCILLENVEEFRKWGPLDAAGMPIKERAGEEFDLFVRRLKRLGGRVEFRELRACDYGAPTSRKRLYMVVRFDGLPCVWPEPTHGKPGSPEVLAGTRLPWRTAAECIDWSIPCPSIFDRKRALKEATHRRIAHGVMRYVVNAASPFIVPLTHHGSPDRGQGIGEPVVTVTGAHRGELALVDAAIVPITHTQGGNTAASTREPLRTITTAKGGEFAGSTVTLASVSPARPETPGQDGRGEGAKQSGDPDRVDALPHRIAPHVMKFRAQSPGADIAEPMPTVTANGQPKRQAGATPLGVAAARLVQMGYGERDGQLPRALDVAAPLGTVVAGGAKHGLVTAFLSHFYTSNTNGGAGDPAGPVKTVTSGGQHHAVVCAHIEQANAGPRNGNLSGRAATAPFSTITATGSQQRVVETALIEADALPPEMMARAVRVAAFLIKYYGAAAHGQAVDQPLDAVTSKARFAVVTVTIDAVTYVIVDIGMRMLSPRELARAQGFPDSYILDPVGPSGKPLSKSAQIRMIGNSVCPDVAEALVRANLPELCAAAEPVEVAA